MARAASGRRGLKARLVWAAAVAFLSIASSPADAHAQAVAREVSFAGAGGLQMRGTLLLPAGTIAAPGVPAVLLLPGSGPTDRNGNQPPMLVTNLLQQIAERLAADGIATLRFDKRAAHVHAADWPKALADMSAFFSYENFIGDATAAYRWLRAADDVDESRVGILGHSEGGLFALQIARDLSASADRPAGVILAATGGRVLDDVLREQIASALARQTTDQAVRDQFMAHLERGIAAVRNQTPIPSDLPPGLQPIFNPSALSLLRAYFSVDPVELAAAVRGPVLVIQGREDAQVSAERDAPRLEAALKARKASAAGQADAVEVAFVAGASHNFKAVGAGAAAAGFVGPTMPEALQIISDWCRRRLRADYYPLN